MLMPRIPTPTHPKDESIIVDMLSLSKTTPSLIMEAGSGSGSMTIYLSNALYTYGTLHSYDTNLKHIECASANYNEWISTNNLPKNTTFINKDVSEFECPDFTYDGVVIDLLDIENILKNIYPKTKYGAPIIIFSPNISSIIDIISMIDEEKLPLKTIKILLANTEIWDIRIKNDSLISKPHFNNHTGFILHLMHFELAPDEAIVNPDLPQITCLDDFELSLMAGTTEK